MSPHFGLMDESSMSRTEALQMRFRLHWRSGVRKMRESKTADGLAILYDALLSAMRWYILTNLRQELGTDYEEQLENERFIFALLRREGVLDSSFDLSYIEESVDRALMEEDVCCDPERVLSQLEQFLRRIKALPFDASKLPPELPESL